MPPLTHRRLARLVPAVAFGMASIASIPGCDSAPSTGTVDIKKDDFKPGGEATPVAGAKAKTSKEAPVRSVKDGFQGKQP